MLVIDGYKDYEKYFRVFYAFDLMLSGAARDEDDAEITAKDAERLNWFVRNLSGTECGDSDHDEYVVNTFTAYTRNKKHIVINMFFLSEYFPEILYEQIVHSLVKEDGDE